MKIVGYCCFLGSLGAHLLSPTRTRILRPALTQRFLSFYLHLSFSDKDTVKQLGGKYDPIPKKWYVPDHLPLEPFERWIREDLQVPFTHKDKAKQLGALWDFQLKRWYVKGRKNLSQFNQWRIIPLQIPPSDLQKAIGMGVKTLIPAGSTPTVTLPPIYYIPLQTKNIKDFIAWLPKLYLHVPLSDIQIVQEHGAQWDNSLQKWFIYEGLGSDEFLEKYFHPKPSTSSPSPPSPSSSSSSSSSSTVITTTPASATPTPSSSSSATSPSFKLLFFDVETTGLPQFLDPGTGWSKTQRYPSYTDLPSYDTSRIVQLSYLICSYPSMTEISRHDTIIKCSNFTIENSHLHGITTDLSLQQGVSFESAIQDFMTHCHESQFLIAHNYQFDYHILLSELYRHQLFQHIPVLQHTTSLCTMELSRNFLLEKYSVTPSLKNLYESVMGKGIEGQHNSMHDVSNLFQATKKLLELGVIQIR